MGRQELPGTSRVNFVSRRWLGLGVVPLALLLAHCESRRVPERVSPKSPPFPVATASAAPAMPSAPQTATDFHPLLASPELASVATLLESQGPGAAARELENLLAKSPPGERFRQDFLLGRLHEQASEFLPASAAYARVSAGSSPLTEYAHVAEARSLLALGRAKEALDRLASVPDEGAVARLKWPVLADAARLAADRPLAIRAYGHSLEALTPGADRADYSLRFAELLLGGPASSDHDAELTQALSLTRRAQNETGLSRQQGLAAQALEARVLAALPEALRKEHQSKSPNELLEHLRALVDSRKFDDVEGVVAQIQSELPEAERHGPVACEAQFLLGKALSGHRAYAKAGEVFDALLSECKADDDLRARARFMAGKAAASDGQHMLAAQRFAALEQEYPKNSLADDARLYGALAYLELGVEARFTELLNALPDDYPDGDMVVEGAFRLALRRFDKQDFQGAARVLERVLENKFSTAARAADFAGRERYFHARALAATGEGERALKEYEALVRELPLSYYMLCAYTALSSVNADRAHDALSSALAPTTSAPLLIKNRPEFSGPGFTRALELFGVGDLEDGSRELDDLGLADAARPDLLWGLSNLYAKAGSVKLSHAAARRALSAAPSSWPVDDWVDAWKLAYPAPYGDIVTREAKRSLVNPALIYAIMREESAFDADAESPADAFGLMQLIVPTAKTFARPLGLPFDRRSLKRPNVNVALGASVLAKYASAFPDNPLLAIPAYNAGPLNPRRWLKERPNADFDLWVELIPFVETRRYLKRVLSSR